MIFFFNISIKELFITDMLAQNSAKHCAEG
jgi:hypothetical protein